MWGEPSVVITKSDPSGLKVTPLPSLPGFVEGFAYLAPKPELQEYAVM